MVGASVATSPISGTTMPMRERGKMMYADANTVGIMPPPMKPCSARQTIISPIEDVKPHIRLAIVNPPAAAANMMRVPSTRERKPEKRNGDDLGHQVCGLHPGDPAPRGRKPGLTLRQRGRHDLDVEPRHEHAEAHHQERD